MTEPDLADGQIWLPAPGPRKRANAREIVRIAEHLGVPHVFWSPFWPNCGHTDVSTMRVNSFRRWIRMYGATVEGATMPDEITKNKRLEAALRPFAKAAKTRTIQDALSFAPQTDVMLTVTRGCDKIELPASAFAAAMEALQDV